jgi:putative phosphoribosyl transferase
MQRHQNQGEVIVAAGETRLSATLVVPADPIGVIVIVQDNGNNRYGPRSSYLARFLQEGGFATLLIDLLTPDEACDDTLAGHLRFQLGALAERLIGATEWLAQQESTRDLPLGYFGLGTGAAVALVAAARVSNVVRAIVSSSGRPDLAGDSLEAVRCPTLLLVGGGDRRLVLLNQRAFEKLAITDKRLQIIIGAGDLLDETGPLESVAESACDWFDRHASTSETSDAGTAPPLTIHAGR